MQTRAEMAGARSSSSSRKKHFDAFLSVNHDWACFRVQKSMFFPPPTKMMISERNFFNLDNMTWKNNPSSKYEIPLNVQEL